MSNMKMIEDAANAAQVPSKLDEEHPEYHCFPAYSMQFVPHCQRPS